MGMGKAEPLSSNKGKIMIDAIGYEIAKATQYNTNAFSEFAQEKHKYQIRRDGTPYFGHCLKVDWATI